MPEPSSEAIFRLVRWTLVPDPPGEILTILKDMTEQELWSAAHHLQGPAGRIAWAEYGRRKRFVDFDLRVTELDGDVRVLFEGEALPIHESVIVERRKR